MMELLPFIYQKISNEKGTGCFCFSKAIMGLPQSLKLWRNLFLLSWPNFSRSLVSNLTPTGSCIENKDICFIEKKFINIDFNSLTDSAFRIVLSNLFHSLTQKGKTECLKLSVLQENSGELFLFADLVW